MSQKKVYKINENQLKLIVGSQKTNSPQLQTEMLDATAAAFTKLLSWGFKQSISAFKYLTGIGVNVFSGDRYTPTGKVPVKKSNWLLPLGLYNPKLIGKPKNYQNLFTTLYQGIQTIDKGNDSQDLNQTDDAGSTDNNTMNLDDVSTNLKFDSVDGIVYNIKFQFTNLKKEAKENAELMMTTWALIFNVVCQGKVTDTNTMLWSLVGFSSQVPNFMQMLSMASKNNGNPNDKDEQGLDKFFKKISNYGDSSANDFSLIFSNTGQSQKFEQVMKQQIDANMKVMIGELNAKMGLQNVIKQPQITVKVHSNLIGDIKIQETQSIKPLDELENDLQEIARQIAFYKDQEQYQDYVAQLKSIFTRLMLNREQIKQNKK